MRIVRIAGEDEASRASLAAALTATLSARGLSLSVLGRCDPETPIDRPGKDSHAHRAAGARDVAVASRERWAVVHEARQAEPEPSFAALLGRLQPVDILFVLGFDDVEGELIRLDRQSVNYGAGRPFQRADVDGLAASLVSAR